MSELHEIALQILSKGKGILAADESTATMTKRLDSVNVVSDENNRLLQSDYEKRYFDLVIQKESLKSQFELTNKKLVKALSYNKL